MGEKAKSGSWKIWAIVISVLSVVIIAASVVAVVLNAGKNAPTSPEQQTVDGGLVMLSSEEYEKDKVIIDEINDYVYPISQEEAVAYIEQKAEEYRNENVSLPIAQMKVNMFYNALDYEKAEKYGKELEEKYDIDKYPVPYRLDFYYEMRLIYEALWNEEQAEHYKTIGEELAEKYYESEEMEKYGAD